MICKLIFENIFENHYFDLSQSDIYIYKINILMEYLESLKFFTT